MPSPTLPESPPGVFQPGHVCRPDPKLLTHYIILCLLALPAFPVTFLVSYFRYHTLRYHFDADGVSMQVGILFRRETVLQYRRIQDIHVTRGIIQRWLGLATVACQTASGSSSPELVIEGLLDYERVRDFLYAQMRGAKEGHPAGDAPAPSAAPPAPALAGTPAHPDETLAVLMQIRDGVADMKRDLDTLRAEVRAGKEPPHA